MTLSCSYFSACPLALMFLAYLSEPHQLSFSVSQSQDVTPPPANANVTDGGQGQRALRELIAHRWTSNTKLGLAVSARLRVVTLK